MHIQAISSYYGNNLQNTNRAGLRADKQAFGDSTSSKDIGALEQQRDELQFQIDCSFPTEWAQQPDDTPAKKAALEYTQRALDEARRKSSPVKSTTEIPVSVPNETEYFCEWTV